MLQIKNTLGGGKPEGLYVWKKLSAQGGDFIDYVVSDKETAYPDGGEKGGYWYERVVEGAKVASGEITFSSAVNTFTVEHGLGAKPKYVFLICIKKNSDATDFKVTSGYKYNESGRIIAMQAYDDSTSKVVPAASVTGEFTTSTFAEIEADATNIIIPVSYIYMDKVNYIGTYKWFAIG